MPDFPVHARFDGPIVMIGFGSIGRGTLPLLERHIQFDRSKFVVIDPVDTHRGLLDERKLKFIKVGLTKANFREVLTSLRGMTRAVDLDLPDLVTLMLGTGCRIGEHAPCGTRSTPRASNCSTSRLALGRSTPR